MTDISEVVRRAIHSDYVARFPSPLFEDEKPKPSFELKSVNEILEAESDESGSACFYISTGSARIDGLLGNQGLGIPSGVITHVYGASGAGKTQMSITLAASVSKIGKVLYIDTERGTYLHARIKEVTGRKEGILDNIIHQRVHNVAELESLIDYFSTNETIGEHSREDFRLIVVDSISQLYRIEMPGTDKTQRRNIAITLNMAKLHDIAEKNNIAVFVTNQTYSEINTFATTDNVTPYAKNAIRSKAFYTLYLRAAGSSESFRIAKLVSSPDGVVRDALFSINASGITDKQE